MFIRGKSLLFNPGDLWQSWQSYSDPAPPPYVHPFPPKVTQSTQELAEGRNPKMTKRNGFTRCVFDEFAETIR